uniref:GAG-pre-integrase domain-containing protein n=1 Tax=Solanum lycopersicum TaxID=4081 RepID=A0A3Q7J8P2_SOLLC
MVKVLMAENKMFPLEDSNVENIALVIDAKNDSDLWHLRYGHLNIKGLKFLCQKDSTDEGQWSDPNSVEEVIEPETFTILEEPSSERIPLRRST